MSLALVYPSMISLPLYYLVESFSHGVSGTKLKLMRTTQKSRVSSPSSNLTSGIRPPVPFGLTAAQNLFGHAQLAWTFGCTPFTHLARSFGCMAVAQASASPGGIPFGLRQRALLLHRRVTCCSDHVERIVAQEGELNWDFFKFLSSP